MNERKTKCDALLDLLADGQAHNQRDVLNVAGFRYTGRLKELRDAGHNIESIHVGGAEWWYRLIVPVEPKQMALI